MFEALTELHGAVWRVRVMEGAVRTAGRWQATRDEVVVVVVVVVVGFRGDGVRILLGRQRKSVCWCQGPHLLDDAIGFLSGVSVEAHADHDLKHHVIHLALRGRVCA